ncbi:MAG: signal peptide peptidase SppA [Saprospiraceae bacterium]
MKQFFKFTFASCLGMLLFAILTTVIGGVVFSKMANSAQKAEKTKPNTVLKISLSDIIPERTNNVAINPYEFNTDDVIGLQEMIGAIERAKTDDDIKGIYLELANPQLGFAGMSVLRRAIEDFKTNDKDKFVIAYGDGYSQKSYYLASVADEIYMNPIGGVDFRGLSGTILFFKDMLDRLGIDMQVFYVGNFKSATEPFRRTDMSEANRLQVREYMESLYGVMLEDISKSRKIPVTELRAIADEYQLREADDAVRLKFVDKLLYKDEMIALLKEEIGLDKDDDINAMSVAGYNKANPKSKNLSSKSKIAVVYAEGSIVDGEGENGQIGGDKYSKIIRDIRKDKKVKAIVLRVNSGGGSGFASEKIWRELMMAKEQGLPIIVSMGDVAASGGYYIAAPADKILVEKNTITGSIGVFGVIPSMADFLKNEIGITADTVKTGKFSTGITPFYDVSEEEGKIIQASVEDFYDLFLGRVAQGRNMDTSEVHKVAQGRVWTGQKAIELGLADEVGDLAKAIEIAANKAGLSKYRTSEYPAIKNPFQQIVDDLTGKDDKKVQQASRALIEEELGELYPYYEQMKEIRQMKGIQAKMPYTIEIK